MIELQKLLDRILQRVNINLRELGYDASPYVRDLVPLTQKVKFYAFYGITLHHPLDLQFHGSSLAGSYFLGRCRVRNSLLYKTDIRGDELKKKGSRFHFQGQEIVLTQDERFDIEDCYLIKTLVHNYSHDPETPEHFFIKDTVSTHYANIHGSPTEGCFLGPFATVDLTTVHDCIIGPFSYIQAGEIDHLNIPPGTVWVRAPGKFNFLYRFPLDALSGYIAFDPGTPPQGALMDFANQRKHEFQRIFDVVNIEPSVRVPPNASLDRYAVIRPKTRISENVLVAQRAFLQNASLGKGANAQENCYIINSRLEGFNVTAHGAKIIEADLGTGVFVGFNSFLQGRAGARLTIGADCIIMPHTIIDIQAPLTIPPNHLAWGLIRSAEELAANSMPLDAMAAVEGGFHQGDLFFEGSGSAFVKGFQQRIHHILEANGAFYDGTGKQGHAQHNQNISFNILQPYPEGPLQGLSPTTIICD